jgi:hypothetical protein
MDRQSFTVTTRWNRGTKRLQQRNPWTRDFARLNELQSTFNFLCGRERGHKTGSHVSVYIERDLSKPSHRNNVQNYNFACGSVWVWNLVSDIKGATQTGGALEQGAEEDIQTEERWGDVTVETIT